jgi:uncharacterized phage protein gp47/JayE
MSIPVNKTLEEIRTSLFEQVGQVQQDGWLPQNLNLNRGPIRGLIELWAWGLYQLYLFLAAILPQAFPNTSTGEWLDLHSEQLGLERLPAAKALGNVYFTRDESGGNVNIPANRIVKTLPDGLGMEYRFITLEDTVLPSGELEIPVSVSSEEYGRNSNVTPGMISEIVTPIVGVDAVENRSDWLTLEGSDEENDASLRERYALKWKDVNGATRSAYESWARSVTGVVAVTILDHHPRGQGTVDVVLKGAAGVPTDALIAAVDAVVQEMRPINDDVLVKGPTPVDVAVSAQLELVHGDPDGIMAEVENRLRAMFQDPSPVADVAPLQVGEDLTLDRMIHEIMAVSGVKRVIWVNPTADVATPADGLAVLTSVSLTTTWASEI